MRHVALLLTALTFLATVPVPAAQAAGSGSIATQARGIGRTGFGRPAVRSRSPYRAPARAPYRRSTRPAFGHGIGGAILRELMLQAKARGDRTVILNAQTQAEPFYQRFGFARSGEEFMEAGIPHVEMRHTFSE